MLTICIELKDVIFLIIGVVIGLIVGIGIYWWPLGQFCNEWCALRHLGFIRYKRGRNLKIIPGRTLTPLNTSLPKKESGTDTTVRFFHDEGIGWHHTPSGWKRARILHVYLPTDSPTLSPQDVYKICHLDLID